MNSQEQMKKLIVETRKEVHEKHPDYQSLSTLEKHVYAFGELKNQQTLATTNQADDNELTTKEVPCKHSDGAPGVFYSKGSIAKGLQHHGENHPDLVGFAIYAFNATHSGHFIYGQSVPLRDNASPDFAKSLHLGTLRLYQKDGSFCQNNWDEYFDDKQQVELDNFLDFLAQKTEQLPQEQKTGRNTNCYFSSKKAQVFAASAAWNQVFKMLACDWKESKTGPQPIVNTDILQLFFSDTLVGLTVATKLNLPIAVPKDLLQQSPDNEETIQSSLTM